MKYQLLLTDIDGTLIPYDRQEISAAHKQALIGLQQKGCIVAIASGRVTQGIEKFAQELRLAEFGGFIISNNGAEIINCKTREVLYRNPLTTEDVHTLYQESVEHDIHTMLMQEEFVIMTGYDEAVHFDHNAVGMDFIWPTDMKRYLDRYTLRMNFTKTPERLDEVEQIFVAKYGDRFEIMRPQRRFLDVMRKDVDKGTALLRLAEHLNIPLEAVVACGDGGNDYGMIQKAGLGVAMADAFESVKEIAQVIAPTAKQDGLAWLIENYL